MKWGYATNHSIEKKEWDEHPSQSAIAVQERVKRFKFRVQEG
jgi:hypothetical protein